MTARHHHFLPQCYLRGFAHHRDKAKLFVVDGKDGKTFTTQPANIAQERDFHRIDAEGLAPDALEAALSQVESDIAPALERIARTGSMVHGDDRLLVMTLAALIAVKNPRRREMTRSAMEEVARKVTFPVSKEVALVGTFEHPSDTKVDLTIEQVAQLNTLIIAGADRRIFARDSTFEYLSAWSGKVQRGVDTACLVKLA